MLKMKSVEEDITLIDLTSRIAKRQHFPELFVTDYNERKRRKKGINERFSL